MVNLRIKAICAQKGVTQKSLSEMIEVSTTSLSRIITGEQKPSLDTLEKIANALGVDISELFAPSSSGSIIGVIRIGDTNYNINSVPDLSNLLNKIEEGEIVL